MKVDPIYKTVDSTKSNGKNYVKRKKDTKILDLTPSELVALWKSRLSVKGI